MPKALITGISGQDGWFLAKLLLSKGYSVFGVSRTNDKAQLLALPGTEVIACDLSDASQVNSLIETLAPDQCYHLAAHHHSSGVIAAGKSADPLLNDFSVFEKANLFSTQNLLNALSRVKPQSRFFLAGSCHMYGMVETSPQNELTPMHPTAPYAVTKVAAKELVKKFRKENGYFACTGILFNHESWRRSPSFVTKKVVNHAVRIKKGELSSLTLGSLDSQVDWGFAGDTVRAMEQMLAATKPDDYVVATGQLRSIRDLVEHVFKQLDLNWRDHVQVDSSLVPKTTTRPYCGDATRLREATGWTPETPFQTWLSMMVDQELGRAPGPEFGVFKP